VTGPIDWHEAAVTACFTHANSRGVTMSNVFWLTEDQMERLRPFFPKSHGKPRVDDRRVLREIIFINRNGLRWCDAPREYGPPKTLYNRWKRWGDMGVFTRMMERLASEGDQEKVVMIDATFLKAHRTALSLRVKKCGRQQARPPHRTYEGRAEHQAARLGGCRWTLSSLLHDSRRAEVHWPRK
jgi:transposase